jgi:hypothetical protein
MKRTGDSHDGAWLSNALRGQAQSHDADLERITARFEQLTSEGAASRIPRRRVLGPMRVRLLGIPLGIAAALASATVALAVSVGIAVSASPHQVVPVTSPKTSAAATTAAPNPPTASSAPTEGPTASATAKETGGDSGATGKLASAASVDTHSTEYWVQEDLNVTPTSTIRDLRITVTVSGGSSVASTGIWTTIAPANLNTTVTRVSGGLEYEVTLKPGQSLKSAVYRFGFQFNRPASGHDFALDTYSVSATAADGATLSATGAFRG